MVLLLLLDMTDNGTGTGTGFKASNSAGSGTGTGFGLVLAKRFVRGTRGEHGLIVGRGQEEVSVSPVWWRDHLHKRRNQLFPPEEGMARLVAECIGLTI